ncbi:MAG: SDR family NAD(P)-dependent oxidoreductase [Verrucomicrobiales bacterium]|nr:SDR family NAD(P)-dependent oxidoreductase [Verrucomicrobiales bacterium]
MSQPHSTPRSAVVTGAGSGVGRATALALAREGWRVALVGRRLETLIETERHLLAETSPFLLCPCDLADESAVATMGTQVLEAFHQVDVLINAAGTNTPRRSLEVLSSADYRRLIDTNLNGAYWCVQAFLPAMRSRGAGTIINVISDAARQASPKAGPAYSASKFGLLGLTQAINAEERARGIRACALLPGDIDTPLLDKRPAPPNAEARARMLQPEDVAACALFAIHMPPRAVIEEILVRPA